MRLLRPVLFLDVDGVLNRSATAWGRMHADLVQRMAEVVLAAGCDVVVSSGWRHGGIGPESAFYKCLARLPGGFDILIRVVGHTGTSDLGRAVEIAEWLNAHRTGAAFAVVDDHDMREHFGERQVLTTSSEGLPEAGAKRLIELLTQPKEVRA